MPHCASNQEFMLIQFTDIDLIVMNWHFIMVLKSMNQKNADSKLKNTVALNININQENVLEDTVGSLSLHPSPPWATTCSYILFLIAK